MDSGAGTNRDLIRAGGQYARVGGVWYSSAHSFPAGRYPVDKPISLYSSVTGNKFTAAAADIEQMQDVVTHARYRGFDVTIGSIWSGPHPPTLADSSNRIRGAVAAEDGDFHAAMLYRGPDGRALLELPGTRPREEWPPSYDEIIVTAPVAELTDYYEVATAMHPMSDA